MKRLTVTLLAALAAGPLLAADRAPMVPPTLEALLTDLHDSNHVEVMMGGLAKDKGNSAAMKEYGTMLVKDHSDADKKVQALADKRQIRLPAPGGASPDKQAEMAKHHDAMQALQSLPGAEFDKKFAQAMVEDHQKDIGKLKATRPTLSDPEAKKLVDELLPVLEKHLKTAEQLAA